MGSGSIKKTQALKNDVIRNDSILLDRQDDDMARAAFAFGGSFDARVIPQCNMNDSALVGGHRTQLNTTMLTGGLVGRRTSNSF